MAKSASILVADDEDNDVELLKLALRRSGLTVDCLAVRDGQEAVNYLVSHNSGSRPLPGLFLLDLKMPNMTGFDVLIWLGTQPHLKELPVVVFSSSADHLEIEKALKLGAREYVIKPHDLPKLTSVMKEICSRYLDGDAPPVAAS